MTNKEVNQFKSIYNTKDKIKFIENLKMNKEDWYKISDFYFLSEGFIEHFKDVIYWKKVTESQILSNKFIDKHSDKLSNYWREISCYKTLDEKLLEKNIDKLHWNNISKYQDLSEEFISNHKNDVNWEIISIYQNLSEEFITKYEYDVNWGNIFRCQNLSNKFLEKYIDIMDWTKISFNKLPTKFIEKYTDKLTINYLIYSLNEDLIYKYIDEIDIYELFETRKDISIELIEKIFDKILKNERKNRIIKGIIEEYNLPNKFIDKHYNDLDESYLIEFQDLSIEIIDKIIKDLKNYKPDDKYSGNRNANRIKNKIYDLIKNQNLPFIYIKEFIEKYSIDLDKIVEYQDLNEKEILYLLSKYKSKISNKILLKHQIVSKEILKENKDYFYEELIILYQHMDIKFIKNKEGIIDFKKVIQNKFITKEFIEIYKDKLNLVEFIKIVESRNNIDEIKKWHYDLYLITGENNPNNKEVYDFISEKIEDNFIKYNKKYDKINQNFKNYEYGKISSKYENIRSETILKYKKADDKELKKKEILKKINNNNLGIVF